MDAGRRWWLWALLMLTGSDGSSPMDSAATPLSWEARVYSRAERYPAGGRHSTRQRGNRGEEDALLTSSAAADKISFSELMEIKDGQEEALESGTFLPPCGIPKVITDAGNSCEPAYADVQRKKERTKHRVGKVVAKCISFKWVFTAQRSLKYAHMASIASLADGSLVVVFQAAPEDEGDLQQRLVAVTSRDGGRSWSHPTPVFPASAPPAGDSPMWGPALYRHGDTISLFFSQGSKCTSLVRGGRYSPGGDIAVTGSRDGKRWEPPTVLYAEAEGDGLPKVTANPPVLEVLPGATGGGLWMLPFWSEEPRDSTCNASTLHGTAGSAWTLSHEVADLNEGAPPAGRWKVQGPIKHTQTWLIESSMVACPSGTLVQLFRTTGGRVYRTASTNHGQTWSSPEPTLLPNPNSKVNAIVLSNGFIAVCYNAHTRKEYNGVRTHLYIAVSKDDGENWETLAELENGTDNGKMFHYPTMLQRGCMLYIVYSAGFRGAGAESAFSTREPYGAPRGQMAGIKLAQVELSFLAHP